MLAQRLAVQGDLGQVIDAVKHQGAHYVGRLHGQGKRVLVPQRTLVIVPGAVPVGGDLKRAPA